VINGGRFTKKLSSGLRSTLLSEPSEKSETTTWSEVDFQQFLVKMEESTENQQKDVSVSDPPPGGGSPAFTTKRPPINFQDTILEWLIGGMTSYKATIVAMAEGNVTLEV
jgi:hypothetical protein